MTDQIPSSVRGLLCEIRPNLALTQVIKAADQLYYKDKRLYGQDMKPELFGATDSGKGKQQQKEEPGVGAAAAHGNEQHGQGQGKKKGKKQQQQKEEALEPKMEQQQHKMGDANAAAGGVKKQSKLQEMIGQAKQTVQHALQQNSSGGGYGGEETEEGELAALRAENAQLRARLEQCEGRLRELELQQQHQ